MKTCVSIGNGVLFNSFQKYKFFAPLGAKNSHFCPIQNALGELWRFTALTALPEQLQSDLEKCVA